MRAHSASLHTQPEAGDGGSRPVIAGWGVGGKHVVAALRSLTRAERSYVEAGYIGGDPMPSTIRSLQHKAMFYLHITSPNGRCGCLKLTPLGESVRATIAARKTRTASSVGTSEASAPQHPSITGETRT